MITTHKMGYQVAALLIFVVMLNLALADNRRWTFSRFRNRNLPRSKLVPGDECDPRDLWWYPVSGELHKFAYCHRESRKIVTDSCATVNGIQKLFDEAYQQCVMPAAGEHKAPGLPRSSRFGEACVFNTDCLNNMYCPAGTCLCLVGFIDVGSDCYTVINPGQNGCISKRQCEAVWPGSDCDDGVCQCPKPKTAVETRDGFVCIGPGACPLPEDSEASTPPAQLSTTVDTSKPQCVPKVAASTDKQGCYDSGADQSLGELYDCIPADAAAAAADVGLCCPNRALTCILPKKTSSNGSKGVTRYWYNSVTANCEQFLWDPTFSESTANNFRTVDQCRSYCQTSCKRGAPEYTGVAKSSKPKSCSVNSECTRSGTLVVYQCSTVGARQFCCPSTDWICGPSGGRDYTPSQSPDPGPATSTKTAVVRWYYEATAQVCRSFSYKGEGGNFNNFHTMEECNAFCARSLCDRGDPLKDSSNNNQACTGSRGCPSTYECRQSVCCPRKQTVCVQPKMVGTCTSAISRYWYNAATRDCEQFVYTGCNGNDNNFESYLVCQNYCRDAKPEPKCIQGEADKDSSGNYYTCSLNAISTSTCRLNYECYFDGYMYGCCPTKAWTCSLNRQAGTACVASTVRWYFDSTAKSCQTFPYSGCDGNSNNFQTRQQCEQYCGVGGCPFGGEPYQDSNTMQRKVCNAQSAPCPSGYECTSVTVSGNPISYCCPTRAYICGQSPNQGSQCGSTLQRYYFNIATKVCTTFTYFGCSGNENNFATLSQCNNFCSSAACAPGESVYLDANTQKPVTCNIGLQSGCPPTYVCKMDSLTAKNLCCGSSDLGVCPAHERAYVEALSQTARECQPGVSGTCPTNFLCRANQGKNRYYCCAPDAKALCPMGRASYRDPVTHQAQTCYINTVTKSCPAGFVCQSSIGGVSQGFCCSAGGMCPKNTEFYAEPVTGKPRQCVFSSSGDFSQCPTGYACKLPGGTAKSSSSGYCCKLPPPPASAVCNGGKAVLETGGIRSCASGQPCPTGSVCTPYAANGQSYCCQQSAPSATIKGRVPPMERNDGCPPGTSILTSANTCDLINPQSCPVGYSCQFNKEEHKYQCCGVGQIAPPPPPPAPAPAPVVTLSAKSDDDGCPMGQVSAIDVGAQTTRLCTIGIVSDCPIGYACLYSASLRRNQCCGLAAGCPDRSVAFIDSSSGRPQTCSADNACPLGFICKATTNGNVVCCSSNNAPLAQTQAQLPPTTLPTPLLTPASSLGNLCPAGQALEDPRKTGSPKLCSDSNNCPAGYECLPSRKGAVCCPNRSNVCNLPLNNGGARCPEGLQNQRYFYNSKTGICQQFAYNGCEGNDNNFANVLDCDNYCAKGMCPRGEPAKSGGSFRFCNVDESCPTGYDCLTPVYGPIEKQICCPSKSSICSTTSHNGEYCIEGGDNDGVVPRFYYDARANSCQRIDYRGCGGNGNNFFNIDDCQTYCAAAKTKPAHLPVASEETITPTMPTLKCSSANSKPYVSSGETSPLRCRPGQPGHCPNGYTCQNGGVQNLYLCCSSLAVGAGTTPTTSSRGFCPKNAQVYSNSRTSIPQTCSTYLACPPDYRCLFSPSRRRGFCCKYINSTASATSVGRSETEGDCPPGLSPYTTAASRAPVLCPLGGTSLSSSAESSCPIGYACAYSTRLRRYICCGRVTQSGDNVKPGDQTAGALSTSRESADNGCARGRPFIYPGTRIPLACPNRQSAQCPRGFSCELNPVIGQYQCCSISWRWSGGQFSGNGSNEQNSTTAMTSTTPWTTVSSLGDEDVGGEYVELLPLSEEISETYKLEQAQSSSCDASKRKYLGEVCCADEQCPYGCRTHRHKKMCLCQSHMILDMTRKPFRCSPTCWAWRDGGTCIRHPAFEDDARAAISKGVR